MSTTLPTIDALGTTWWIEIFDAIDNERCTVIHSDITAFLSVFETKYSRFKADSYIGILNSAGTLPHPESELQTLLQFGIDQYGRTEGIFNLMVGAKLVATGYDAAYSFTPKVVSPAPLPNPNEVLHISSDLITLDDGLVDFGGFGKGWAIDAVAALLREKHNLSFFLVNGGGDMYATSDHGQPITIYLEHPTEINTYISETTLLDQGFAASSPHKRSWKHEGKIYSHIIDSTGLGSTAARPDGTFIKADTACTADIFATVALLATPEQLTRFAMTENLGIARFFLETGTLEHNETFN